MTFAWKTRYIELVLWHREVLGTIIGYLDGIPLVTYDRIEIDPEELSTDGIADGNLGGLLLSYRLVSVDGIPLGTNLDTKL